MSWKTDFPPDVEERLAALPEPDLDDADNPEWTEEDFARAVRVNGISVSELHARLTRGEPIRALPVRTVTLDLDAAVVDAFQAHGDDWRERMGTALAQALEREKAEA